MVDLIKPFAIVCLIGMTSGCASFNKDFNCPAKSGIGCKSIHEVNQMVNEGELADAPKSSVVNHTVAKHPKRTQETVLEVHIAPYEDTNGNYHAASKVYTVVDSPKWASQKEQD